MYKLTDCLPEISWTAPGSFVSDVPIEFAAIWRFYLRLKFGSKPSCADGLTIEDLKDNIAMLRVVRSSESDFVEKPFSIVQPCPMSPLAWTEQSVDYLLESARNKMPILLIPMPFAGVSAPITIAGAVSQHLAENLSGVVFSQIMAPGLPVVCAAAASHADMRTMANVMGSVEAQTIDAATIELLNHLKIPSGTGAIFGYSDSKAVDFQAGVESTMGQMMMAGSGLKIAYGLGELAGMDANSLEKIVLDHEVFCYVKKTFNRITVNENTLAFKHLHGIIEKGVDFINSPHTFKNFRKGYHFSDLFDRQARGAWENSGRTDALMKAAGLVASLLAKNDFVWLDEDTDKKLDQVMDEILTRRGFKFKEYQHLLPCKNE